MVQSGAKCCKKLEWFFLLDRVVCVAESRISLSLAFLRFGIDC